MISTSATSGVNAQLFVFSHFITVSLMLWYTGGATGRSGARSLQWFVLDALSTGVTKRPVRPGSAQRTDNWIRLILESATPAVSSDFQYPIFELPRA